MMNGIDKPINIKDAELFKFLISERMKTETDILDAKWKLQQINHMLEIMKEKRGK